MGHSFRAVARRLLIANRHVYLWARRLHTLGRYVLRRAHEPEFAAFGLFRDRRGLFLDIGANIGQSALSFRMHHSAPILSLEPNPAHEIDLRLVKRLIPRFDYWICGAGDVNAEAVLFVPTVRGVPLTGQASQMWDAAANPWWIHQQYPMRRPSDFRVDEIRVEVRRLDDANLSPDFIKIDVEGTEAQVLQGLWRTIETRRPILLIERSVDFEVIRSKLCGLDYDAFEYVGGVQPFRPYHGPVQNVFFLPREDPRARQALGLGDPGTR